MKIKLHFSYFDIEYQSPIIIRNYSTITNTVLKVFIFHEKDLIKHIELTSLPHFHQYNIKEWRYVLEHFFNDHSLNLDNIIFDRPLFNMVKNTEHLELKGELLFIIESILFSIIEHFAPYKLDFIEDRTIHLNALYGPHYLDLIKKKCIPDCLKIKIRPNLSNLNETINVITHFLAANPKTQFRLDGNRHFEFYDLIDYIKTLEIKCGPKLFSAIEYLEEPLKNAHDNYSFNHYFSYPIALDESFEAYVLGLEQLKKFASPLNIIIKPSLFGISKTFDIFKFSNLNHHNIIISSTYETASAIRPLLFLATLNPHTFHGFDTLRFLPNDLSIQSENFCLKF